MDNVFLRREATGDPRKTISGTQVKYDWYSHVTCDTMNAWTPNSKTIGTEASAALPAVMRNGLSCQIK